MGRDPQPGVQRHVREDRIAAPVRAAPVGIRGLRKRQHDPGPVLGGAREAAVEARMAAPGGQYQFHHEQTHCREYFRALGVSCGYKLSRAVQASVLVLLAFGGRWTWRNALPSNFLSSLSPFIHLERYWFSV